jgi:ABC-type antimicrobial peptide transport system permease subunit
LYGVMAYLVERRTREIGVRIALGATRGTVIVMVIREAIEQAVAGLILGIPLAFAATYLLASLLYGVTPADIQHVVAAGLVLMVCMAVASYLPAWRASRLDPNAVLRAD